MLYLPSFLKFCHACQSFRLHSEFPKHRNRKDGLNSQCAYCARSYRERNKGQKRNYNRNFYLSHRADALEKAKEYAKSHKEQRNAVGRKHYAQNKKRVAARHRVYWQNNKDHMNAWQREYYREHPERYQTNSQRRHARKRELPATFTQDDWKRCLDYWHGCCAYCGHQRSFWQTELAQDHFVPIEKGGPYTPDNILPACNGHDGCNQSKGFRDARDWLIEKVGIREASARLMLIENYFEWVRSISG